MQLLTESLAMWPAFVLLLGLLALAGAVRLMLPSSHGRLTRTLPVLVAALASGVTEIAAESLGYPAAASWLRLVVDLSVAFSVVNLAAALLFDVVLPRMGVEVAPIVVELVLMAGWLLSTVLVLTASGFDLTGVAAVSTLVAAFLTISLQATLGNVVGGVAIQFDGSIQQGDWLRLENGREGRVRQVRWRYTTLETSDGNTVLVPNATLLSTLVTVVDRSKKPGTLHRVSLPFVMPISTPPERVVAVVEEALRQAPLPNVSPEPLPDCVCTDLGSLHPGLLSFQARVWVLDPKPDTTTASQVRLRVHAALRRAGLTLGMPTTAFSLDASQDQVRTQLQSESRTLLDRVSLFDCLTPAEKEQLAPRLTYAPYCDGELVTRQGDTAHCLYLLATGQVSVSQDGRLLNHLQAPTLFGELGLMTGAPRSATIRAVGHIVCYRLDKPAFDEVLRARPGIDLALSEILASRRAGTQAAQESAQTSEAERQWWLTRIRSFFRL